ncbi:MAG: GGDEF domain-containing protein [Methylococcaceae bacterium]|nr:MAG: GGDEF domain-containing protein [Methylococcaceae bacterium]
MHLRQSQIKTEAVLNRLAVLTANRDAEMLETSLLKTLSDILHLPDLMLFKLNGVQEPHRIIRFRNGILYKGNPGDAEELVIPACILDAAKHAHFADEPRIERTGEGWVTLYPIIGVDEVFGYVVLFTQQELTDTEMQIVQGLLSIVKNFYALLLDSQQDKLTGLLNRKTFDESIEKLCAPAESENNPQSENERRKLPAGEHWPNWLAVIDIDFFKQVNDKFGHIYGDEVLLLLSQIMKRCFRSQDLLFRYGGEEFLVLASTENKASARTVFERFRREVQAFAFPQVGTVTVSIGVVQVKDQGIASEIVGEADRALYYAKEHGRNSVYFYEDLVNDGLIVDSVKSTAVDFF